MVGAVSQLHLVKEEYEARNEAALETSYFLHLILSRALELQPCDDL